MPRAVAAMPKDFASGFVIQPHSHERAQFIYATAGTMRVAADGSMWVVPPQRALWMPAGVEHGITMLSDVTMRTLYLRDDAAAAMPLSCRVLPVSPLLRELIVRATELPLQYDEDGPAGHVIALLLAELHGLQSLRRAISARFANGRGASMPASAPWRGCSRTRPASASARGASRPACSRPWAGWEAARR